MKSIGILLALVFLCGHLSATTPPPSALPVDSSWTTGRLDNGITYYIRSNPIPLGQADFCVIQKPAGETLYSKNLSRSLSADVEEDGVQYLISRLKTASLLDPHTYRPHLLAVIIVGDIDAKATAELLLGPLSDLPSSHEVMLQPMVIKKETPSETIFSALPLCLPQASGEVSIEFPLPSFPKDQINSAAWYTMDYLQSIFETLLNRRLRYSYFNSNNPGYPPQVHIDSVLNIKARVPQRYFSQSIKFLATEIFRLKSYGFLQQEFDAARIIIDTETENSFAQRLGRTTKFLVQEATTHFISGRGLIQESSRHDFLKEVVKWIDLNHLNQYSSGVLSASEPRIKFHLPETPADSLSCILPDSYQARIIERDSLIHISDSLWLADILNITSIEDNTDSIQMDVFAANAELFVVNNRIRELQSFIHRDSIFLQERLLPENDSIVSLLKLAKREAQNEQYVYIQAPDSLMQEPQDYGKIQREYRDPDTGAFVWVLSNGVQIHSLRDSLLRGRVLCSIVPLNLPEFSTSIQTLSYTLGGDWVERCGAGDYSAAQLSLLFPQCNLRWNTGGFGGGSLKGSCGKQDTYRLLQWINLFFTSPSPSSAEFIPFSQTAAEEALTSRRLSSSILLDTLSSSLSGRGIRYSLADTTTISTLSPSYLELYRKKLFANASAFRFVFVGDFILDSLKDQSIRYLSKLPSQRIKSGVEQEEEYGLRTAYTKINLEYPNLAKENKIVRIYTGSCPYTRSQWILFRLLQAYLQQRFEEKVTVETQLSKDPQGNYSLYLGMRQVAKDSTDSQEAFRYIDQVVNELAQKGPDASIFESIKENQMLEYEARTTNAYNMLQILSTPSLSGPWTMDYITAQAIRDLMRQILEQNNIIEVFLNGAAKTEFQTSYTTGAPNN